jgi:hypothetical protein
MVEITERIGVILVHGIGEQKRFEHLEGQGRLLLDALRRRPGAEVTVDILGSPGASYRSEHNTWASSPSVRIGVREAGEYRELFLHEVWWADVNEPYSIAKQFRFWLWGLSVWNYPRKDSSTSSGFQAMTDPVIPGYGWRRKIIVRCQLFAVSTLFLMAAFPIGIVVILAKRLLNLTPPDFLQTIVNYVSGVKLYNQRRRYGSALFRTSDFLDTMEEPPRVSVRRRMVEIMTDMVVQDQPYARWYVLAHSLGSVVAFNGLMEPGEILANYLGKQRWTNLKAKGFAGKRARLPQPSPDYFDSRQNQPQGNLKSTPPIPARPLWLDADDIVYRHRILDNFKGLLTYGSPLEKFAAIWPARVSVNKTEPHFPDGSEWINIYDPIDQISGVLRGFTPPGLPDRCLPPLINIGYAAHWALIYAHIRYLNLSKTGSRDLGDAIAHWLLGDRPFRVPASPRAHWFVPHTPQHRLRWFGQAVQWVALYLLIGAIGAYFVPMAVQLVPKSLIDWATATWNWIGKLPPKAIAELAIAIFGYATDAWSSLRAIIQVAENFVIQNAENLIPDFARGAWTWLADFWMWLTTPLIRDWLSRSFDFIYVCALITLAVGIFASVFFFRRDPDDTQNQAAQSSLRKYAYQSEKTQFGLLCTPARTTIPWWKRAVQAITQLIRKLRGK